MMCLWLVADREYRQFWLGKGASIDTMVRLFCLWYAKLICLRRAGNMIVNVHSPFVWDKERECTHENCIYHINR